jgi:RNA polymerase sigma-70 factor (ECF subfamily)
MRVAAQSPASVEVAREADRAIAREVKALRAEQRDEAAAERFSEIVLRHQRRASRIAFHYLRSAADADDAVQDAFVKAFTNIETYRDELPFEIWFTKVLVNGCLDRLKARKRRARWMVAMDEENGPVEPSASTEARHRSPEATAIASERRRLLAAALAQLPERQRSVFMLSRWDGYTSREVSEMTGMNESTVRVHLFRAIRRLRTILKAR